MKIKLYGSYFSYISMLKRAFTDPPVLSITFTVISVPCFIISLMLISQGDINAVITIWFSISISLMLAIGTITGCWLYDELTCG